MGNNSTKILTKDQEQYIKPTGLYRRCPWETRVVRKMILERKIAPRYPGSEIACPDSYECPICFMFYPSSLNQTMCCKQFICTECLLQTKPPKVAVSCPFCSSDNFKTIFAIGAAGCLKNQELLSPENQYKLDNKSFENIKVQFASVADRKKLQAEVQAQIVEFDMGQSMYLDSNHFTFSNFISNSGSFMDSSSKSSSSSSGGSSCSFNWNQPNPLSDRMSVSSATRMEEMMIMEAIRRSMLDDHASQESAISNDCRNLQHNTKKSIAQSTQTTLLEQDSYPYSRTGMPLPIPNNPLSHRHSAPLSKDNNVNGYLTASSAPTRMSM